LREQAEAVIDASMDWAPEQRQEILDCVDVELVPIDTVVGEYFKTGLHFLSIDTEGTAFDIVRSMDLKRHRPKVICIEWERPLSEFEQLLAPGGNEKIYQTPHNLMFRC
jgi:Methyltransferase FkbM domain